MVKKLCISCPWYTVIFSPLYLHVFRYRCWALTACVLEHSCKTKLQNMRIHWKAEHSTANVSLNMRLTSHSFWIYFWWIVAPQQARHTKAQTTTPKLFLNELYKDDMDLKTDVRRWIIIICMKVTKQYYRSGNMYRLIINFGNVIHL